MGRLVMRPRARQTVEGLEGVRRVVHHTASLIQDEAVRLTAAELVDTGLMTASWRITDVSGPSGVTYRVHNTARAPEEEGGGNYPLFHEHGFLHNSGKHIAGHHIALRSVDAARR
jgi:hypothetical protein